ncbi:MAG: hypothetical protein A2381_01425 [Bdellovibrionales bacterium RIFOXYB1_FULL_37_110]|nr:MAG: hypothetical protein A2417_02280 [Bdellovibrionales bacterium RIFOXYC1_FULL_37_79]OFZ58877.1 MAG: hypothetical protein A2381_01425 [Bdellovibrionales bacterium RIFOXYB1_FULL_37_110]OFZ64677.1 MAG: hypothetical protein A2577_13510 [Bdellovibrionales bacterium RIFOXYD1_FULL_36_51]
MTHQDEISNLEKHLLEIESEKQSILNRLKELRAMATQSKTPRPLLGHPTFQHIPESPEDKIALFLKLFRCQQSVYPKLWENSKKGIKGYSPACKNEWAKGICNKPKIKCTDCSNKDFFPLNEVAVDAHLRGQTTIGTYAINEDDSCTFLACDFDKKTWKIDIEYYRREAESLGIQAAIERSRSGNGAHAWIFFSDPVPARIARTLGTLILAKCSETNHNISLESYDRFFPNQDFLPKGGFGNLIALPLQQTPRKNGNSIFIDSEGKPYPNQWEYLSQVRCFSPYEVRTLVQEYLPTKTQLKIQDNDASEIADNKILVIDKKEVSLKNIISGINIKIIHGAQLEVCLEGLPSKLITKIQRTASFPNPQFYQLQRMRMPTYPHQRFIFSGELHHDKLILPRGVLDKVTDILSNAGAKILIRDERLNKKGLKLEFKGQLTEVQTAAVSVFKRFDNGILSAPPGTGKTVIGCALIAQRRVPTLILVHRQPLVSQWKERIIQFLGVDKKDIGILDGNKKKRTGKIDLAMLQSLTRSEELESIVGDYSQIIIDECHHIPATSFESVMKQFPARFVIGLTATPYRKDKLEKILFQQCGPIRHEIKSADNGALSKKVILKETGFILPEVLSIKPAYHIMAHHLVNDLKRNEIITNDVISTLRENRFPLLISDRKDHLEQLSNLIVSKANTESIKISLFKINGGLSHKTRNKILDEIHFANKENKKVIILATASLIGEGFDLPELDTLFLAMPLSFKGRMIQYAGRLHRLSDGKTNVLIHDYIDSHMAVTLKMYRNRINAYKEMGYTIIEPDDLIGGKGTQSRLLPDV